MHRNTGVASYHRSAAANVVSNLESSLSEGRCTTPGSRAMTRLYIRRIDAGMCGRCGKRPPLPGRARCEECLQAHRDYNRARTNVPVRPREHNRKVQRALWHKVKDEVYAAYGGYVCACCGETNKVFLSLDHVENDGNIKRKESKGKPRLSIDYFTLRKQGFPPGIQVLCHNCNHGKHLNGGICPHQTAVEPTPTFC